MLLPNIGSVCGGKRWMMTLCKKWWRHLTQAAFSPDGMRLMIVSEIWWAVIEMQHFFRLQDRSRCSGTFFYPLVILWKQLFGLHVWLRTWLRIIIDCPGWRRSPAGNKQIVMWDQNTNTICSWKWYCSFYPGSMWLSPHQAVLTTRKHPINWTQKSA